MANKKLKKIIGKIHLYLGLISGLIVFIVAITGCFWVFQEEILAIFEEKRIIKSENRPFITPSKAKEIALEVLPNKQIHGTAYGHKTDALEVIFYEAEPEFYQSVYLNPYSGKVLAVKNHRAGFFWFILRGHLYLWLPKAFGSQITAYGTMIFVIMLISGIILWWPKNKKNRKQRFTFDWKTSTRWRRKNFDLHSIVGFYISLFVLVLAFSGLIMAFNWIYFVTYKAWGGEKAPQFIIPANIETSNSFSHDENLQPIDRLFPKLAKQYPNYESFEFHYPATDSSAIYVEISNEKGVYYNSDYRFFDQHNLEEISPGSIYGKYTEASLADKVIRMNYDIHVGAIGGIFGKILAFLVSLVAASLPITGFYIWWGRKKKASTKLPTRKTLKQPESTLINSKI
ncbi:MAG: PepSY-associated TM helix domain-containing protein [Bacteroidota bacterium]